MGGYGEICILTLLRPTGEISLVGLLLMRKMRSLGIFQYIADRKNDLITIDRRSHRRRYIENDG